MDIKMTTFKSGVVNLHLHSLFRLSKEGKNWHFMALGISIGKEAFAFHLLGFSLGIGWKE
jgi:hypothetical protein